ncbi:MAG: hypothetical protein ACRYGK_11570 [Janthinobacterium lividum]
MRADRCCRHASRKSLHGPQHLDPGIRTSFACPASRQPVSRSACSGEPEFGTGNTAFEPAESQIITAENDRIMMEPHGFMKCPDSTRSSMLIPGRSTAWSHYRPASNVVGTRMSVKELTTVV